MPAVLSILAMMVDVAYSCSTIISDIFIVASAHSLNRPCRLCSLVYQPSVITKAEPRADLTIIAGITRMIKFSTKNKIRIIECFFLVDVIEEYTKIIPSNNRSRESTKTAQAACLAV